MIFKGFSVAKNCLRPKSAPLKFSLEESVYIFKCETDREVNE